MIKNPPPSAGNASDARNACLIQEFGRLQFMGCRESDMTEQLSTPPSKQEM